MSYFKAPFRYDGDEYIMCTGKNGEAVCLAVRGWGYLTGKGHGALGLDDNEAKEYQQEFGMIIEKLLNEYYAVKGVTKR